MSDQPPSDYEVGYGKPPTHTRFKSGQSGNPKGRPRGARNLANLLEEELQQTVSIVANGRRLKMTKARVIARQQVDKATKGDTRALQTIAKLLAPLPTPDDVASGLPEDRERQAARARDEAIAAALLEGLELGGDHAPAED